MTIVGYNYCWLVFIPAGNSELSSTCLDVHIAFCPHVFWFTNADCRRSSLFRASKHRASPKSYLEEQLGRSTSEPQLNFTAALSPMILAKDNSALATTVGIGRFFLPLPMMHK
jgi:hypothetical protein